jgi:hypothetical protein
MRFMKRALIATAMAVVLVGGSAIAYKAYARYDGWGHGRHHARMSTDDMGAFADARIAALKAGLRLTAEQEPLWPPVETALKELAAKQIERREEFRSLRGDRDESRERINPVERLRKGADRMSEMGADLKKLADVTDPLYQSLDDAQKQRFEALSHAGMRGMRGMNHRDERRGWRRHGELGEGNKGGHMGPRHGGGYEGRHPHMGPRGGEGEQRGPGWRHRTGWTDEAPKGAERL